MADQYQYVKLPDGSYGKFAANATDAQIRTAISKDFPSAFEPDLKTGKGMLPGEGGPVDRPTVKMQTSAAPSIVRAATSILPAGGALAGGLLSSPGIVTSAAGAGLGAAAGKQGELLANHFIFGPEETNPASATGLIKTGEEGLSYAVPTAAAEAGTRALLDQPLETGLRIAPPFTDEELNAQRAANRAGEEKLAQFMSRGYKPAGEAELSQSIREGRAARLPARIASPRAVAPAKPVAFAGTTVPERQAVIPRISAPTPLEEFAARQSAATPAAPKVAPIAAPDESYLLPEPRGAFAGEKPGNMYSIPRDQLIGMAQSAKPGAADVLRNLGKPVIFEPRSTVGFPGSSRIIAAPGEYNSRPLISPPEEEENPRSMAAD